MTVDIITGCLATARKEHNADVNVAVTNLAKTALGQQWRLSCNVNDGQASLFAVFASKHLALYDSGKLKNYDVIRVNRYQVTEVENKAKLMILDAEVVGKVEGDLPHVPAATPAPPVAAQSPAVAPSPSEQPQTPTLSRRTSVTPAALTPGSAMTTPHLASALGGAASNALPKADGSTLHQPISRLNPYQNKWTIRVKLESKQPLKESVIKGEPTAIAGMVFVDDTGAQIEGTFWREMARDMHASLQEGRVYFLSNGNVQPNNRKFSSVDNDYRINFTERTKVKEAPDQDATRMQARFNFVKVDALATKIERKVPADIVAIVTAVGPLGSIKRQADGTEIVRRDLTVVDDTRKSVSVTLWRQQAEGVGAELERLADANPVVILSKMRVSDFNGVSVSGSYASKVLVNPEGYEAADALAAWWRAEGHALSFLPAGDGLGRPGAVSRKSEYKPLTEVAGAPGAALSSADPPVFASTMAVLMDIPEQQKLYYEANPATNKKVEQDASGGWTEVATGQAVESMTRRYIMNVRFADFTAEQVLNVFNNDAESMVGSSADQMHDTKAQDEDAFETALAAPKWTEWSLDVMAKAREYEGKSKMRVNVRSARRVDWSLDCTLLTQRMQMLSA